MSYNRDSFNSEKLKAGKGRSVCPCGNVAVKWKNGPCCARCDRIEEQMNHRQNKGTAGQPRGTYIEPFRVGDGVKL